MPPARAQSTDPIIWEVHPSIVEDRTDSVLRLAVRRQAPFANEIKSVFKTYVPDGHSEHFCISYPEARRIVGAAVRFNNDAPDSSLLDFLLKPNDIARIFQVLVDVEVLDSNSTSLSHLLYDVLTWRNNNWDNLPEACCLAASNLQFGDCDLDDFYDYDASGNPWIADAVFGDWASDNLDPLFTLLDDMGPACCREQLGMASFPEQADRLLRAMASFAGHPNTTDRPFSSDLARATLTQFALATQWAPDRYVIVIPTPPQLQRHRFELGGVGTLATSEEYFFRGFGQQLAFHDPELLLMAQRARTSQEYFTEALRLAQGYAAGRCRAAEPSALLSTVAIALKPRRGRLLQLLTDGDATLSVIVSKLLQSSHDEHSPASATEISTGIARSGTDTYDAALAASVGTSPAAERSLVAAVNRAEFAKVEAKTVPLFDASPLPYQDILWAVASSGSLYLQQTLFNVGRRGQAHDLCRRVFALRSYLPRYAMEAFLATISLAAKPANVQARLKALNWPASQLKALLMLRFCELDFLNDAYYLVIATEVSASQTRVDFSEAMLDPVEMRRMGRFGSALFQAFGWDEANVGRPGELTYQKFCHRLAEELEDLGPRVRHDQALWVSVKQQVKDCYMQTMEFAAMEAQRRLLSAADEAPLGILIPDAAAGPLSVLANHLETLATNSDVLSAFFPATKRASVGPSPVGAMPSQPAAAGGPPARGGVGSKASYISYNPRGTVIYRGKQGYDLLALQAKLPNRCPAAALSVDGDPTELCDTPGLPGHGAQGNGAHDLPPNFRQLAASCWCTTWKASPKPSARPRPDDAPRPSLEMPPAVVPAEGGVPPAPGGVLAAEAGRGGGRSGRGRSSGFSMPRGGKGAKGQKGGAKGGKGKGGKGGKGRGAPNFR